VVAERGQVGIDFLGNRVHQPPAGAGGKYQIIVKGSKLPHVEHHDIAAFIFSSDPGTSCSPFA
jgi:hypothetical protein